MTDDISLVMQSVMSSPQFSSMVASAMQNMARGTIGQGGTPTNMPVQVPNNGSITMNPMHQMAPSNGHLAQNGMHSNITMVANSSSNGNSLVSMGATTPNLRQGRLNFGTASASGQGTSTGSSGMQGYSTPRPKPYQNLDHPDRPDRLEHRNFVFKGTKGAGKNKDFPVITVLLETVDPELPLRASKRETMVKSVEGFGEVPIEFSISDNEEDVRMKIFMNHYDMLQEVTCGIQLYFGTGRGNCLDITPFSNPIVPGRELKPYSKIYVGLMLPSVDKWPSLFFTSTTKNVTCPTCHEEINLSLIRNHFAICTGVSEQGINQIPPHVTAAPGAITPQASAAPGAIPPQHVQRIVSQHVQQQLGPFSVRVAVPTVSLRQPEELVNEPPVDQAAPRELQPVVTPLTTITQLASTNDGLRDLAAHRIHLSRANGSNERNSITFPLGDYISAAVAITEDQSFMANIHLPLDFKLEGTGTAGDGPAHHVFSSLFIHFGTGIRILNELYEDPAKITQMLGEGATKEDVERRLFAYGLFSGLGILHYGLHPEWILTWIDRLIPDHPFITGLNILGLVPLLKDNLSVRSVFQPENWKWEKLSTCFVMDRRATPTTTAERAENRSFDLFKNFLIQVCAGEVFTDGIKRVTPQSIYQFSCGSWMMLADPITVTFDHEITIPQSEPFIGELTLPVVFTRQDMLDAWNWAFHKPGLIPLEVV